MTIANTTDFPLSQGAEKAGRDSIFAGFFRAVVEARTRKARAEVLRVLQACGDDQLLGLGYTRDDIRDIRTGRLVILD